MKERTRAIETVAAPIAAGLVVLVTLLGLIGTAIRDPRPHDIPVGAAGRRVFRHGSAWRAAGRWRLASPALVWPPGSWAGTCPARRRWPDWSRSPPWPPELSPRASRDSLGRPVLASPA